MFVVYSTRFNNCPKTLYEFLKITGEATLGKGTGKTEIAI